MAAESIIQVDNFTAAYGDHVVVKDLTFEVSRGEVFVILADPVAARARCSST